MPSVMVQRSGVVYRRVLFWGHYSNMSKSVPLKNKHSQDRALTREQHVCVGNAIGYCLKIISGIPQGSVLGPLLYYFISKTKIDETHQ